MIHTDGCKEDRLSLAAENFCQECGDIFQWTQAEYEQAMAEIERNWLPADDLFTCDCAADSAWRRDINSRTR
jgi:hypothetical protein